MVDTSFKEGTLTNLMGSALSKAAQISGKAAFLAPEMLTMPFKDLPPRMSKVSILLIKKLLLVLRSPLQGSESFHRKRMNLIIMHFVAQSFVHRFVSLQKPQASETLRHDHTEPVPSVTAYVDELTGYAALYDVLYFLRCHIKPPD